MITVTVSEVRKLALAALSGSKLDYVPFGIWEQLPPEVRSELNRVRTAPAKEH
jgi:hypothetical protein